MEGDTKATSPPVTAVVEGGGEGGIARALHCCASENVAVLSASTAAFAVPKM